MAPLGHLHFHPESSVYCDDFSTAPIERQALFIHEMTHVWQHQKGLFAAAAVSLQPLRLRLKPGRKLKKYGIEQAGRDRQTRLPATKWAAGERQRSKMTTPRW